MTSSTAWRTSLFRLVLAVLLASAIAHGQAPVEIVLGRSAVALNGPWKFQIGDDPRWADARFEDSGWETVVLVAGKVLSAEQAIHLPRLPGWQQRGHARYTGFAWYRMHLRLAPGTRDLALLMPPHFDDSYELFLNGQKLGQWGVPGRRLKTVGEIPKIFDLPEQPGPRATDVTLALRLWNLSSDVPGSGEGDYGGLRGLPIVGSREQIDLLYQGLMADSLPERNGFKAVILVAGLVACVSLLLFAMSRGHWEFLWVGVALASLSLRLACHLLAPWYGVPLLIGQTFEELSLVVALVSIPAAGRLLSELPEWPWRMLTGIMGCFLLFGSLIGILLNFGALPARAVVRDTGEKLFLIGTFLLVALLLGISIAGFRRIGRRAWIPTLPALTFAMVGTVETAMALFPRIEDVLRPLETVALLSVPCSVLAILLVRFVQQQRENQRYAVDLNQAHEVQTLLLPEEIPRVPGFSVECVYLPAQEVGGDFFQVLEQRDGSLFVVLGDVSGKGLPAAMLVAVLVGALRTELEHSSDPAVVLAALNERLVGRTRDGFATCIAARITADGVFSFANAGHLSPYVNGEEIVHEGSLPLGIAAGMTYECHTSAVNPGGRLSFVSDGVVEARNKRHELFGFDRLQALSTGSAVSIAEAAKEFGQEDDITVVTITLVGAPMAERSAYASGLPATI